MIFLTIILFLAILGLLIFVHELGHFVMAKRAGMKVEEFGFGFPPRLFGFKFRDTLYSLNWIPLGGFVKILGEDGQSIDPGAFGTKSAFSRFSVLIAGVTMNVILAWALISLSLVIGSPASVSDLSSLPQGFRNSPEAVTVVFVQPNSPAETAGMKVGDVLLKVDGTEFMSRQAMVDYVSTKAGQQVTYDIGRGNDRLRLQLIPRVQPPEGEGPIGIALDGIVRVYYPWYIALFVGMLNTFGLLVQLVFAIGSLLGSLFTSHSQAGSLTGPVGIAALTRDAMKLGSVYVINLTAILSLNLAIINALPFPALDGGRILFLLIEKIRRRKINLHVEQYVNSAGFFLLIALMIWVTFRDVNRFSPQFAAMWDRFVSLF